jgi:hypothetical protein
MLRHIGIFIIGSVAIANLNAGSVQIQIGGNVGLTSGTLATGGSITTTGAVQQTYGQNLTQGVGSTTETSGSLCAGSTISTCTPTTGYPYGEQTVNPSNEFATANSVTFAMINQATNIGAWAAPTSGTSSITIPIGIFGVTDVDTMLNDEYGVSGGSPITVKFNFSSGAGDTGTLSSESFTLINGEVYRDGFDCTAGTCPAYVTTLSTLSANVTDAFSTTGTDDGRANTVTAGTAYVTAFNVWSGTYTGGTGAYNQTNGTLFLDAQDFTLGSAASGVYLNNFVITDTAGSTTRVSKDALSAVTVFEATSTSTPEPSTVLLLVTGIGAMCLIRRRRKA